MRHTRSSERQRELDELVRVLRVLTQFQQTLVGEPLGAMYVDALEDASRTGSATEIRMMYNDLVEAAQCYPPEQLRQLDRLLQEQADTSLERLFQKRNARITRIRERGRISSDEQYYLVREYFEFIWQDASHAEEANELQQLMSAYEDRKGRAAARKQGQ